MIDNMIYSYGAENVREQIARCQETQHGYIEGHTNATKHTKLGQVQVFCDTCLRWKWTNELCYLAQTRPYVQPG